MKRNKAILILSILLVSVFLFQYCHKDEIPEFTAMQVSLTVSHNSDLKIELPDKFEASIDIDIIDVGMRAFGAYFIRTNPETHRTESYIEVPINKRFVVRISTIIDGTNLVGLSDTITLEQGFLQPFNINVFLSTGSLVVNTISVESIGSVSAGILCSVSDHGGSSVTSRGVVYSTFELPSLDNNISYTSNGNGMGTYTALLEELNSETVYYARAYAVNADTIAYGEILSFETVSTSGTVDLITLPASDITATTAILRAELVDDGGNSNIEKGFVWSTTATPSVETNVGIITSGMGVGVYNSLIENLLPETEYFARAFAKNQANETFYGDIISFTTLEQSNITISTTPISSISYTQAQSGGVITDDGGHVIVERGIVWSSTPNPLYELNEGMTSNGSGSGNFISNLTDLIAATNYFVRAYARTDQEYIQYGNELDFFTLAPNSPSMGAITHNGLLTNSVTVSCEIVNDGGNNISMAGFVWNQSGSPDIASNIGSTMGEVTNNIVSSSIVGLSDGTNYYIRAYAQNEMGISYSEEISLTTLTLLDIGPGGGIIFYLDGISGGLELAPVSTEAIVQWGCRGGATNANGIAIGTGDDNTEVIVQYHNSLPDYYNNPTQCDVVNDGTVAAKHCYDLTYGGYNDWYLPNIEELQEIYNIVYLSALGGLTPELYWSSNENDEWSALRIDFNKGMQMYSDKFDNLKVRAVRKF